MRIGDVGAMQARAIGKEIAGRDRQEASRGSAG
jgi:hypothetical protein